MSSAAKADSAAPAENTSQTPARRTQRLAVALYVAAGFIAGAGALVFTGAAAPTLIGDAGPLGRVGLPIATFIFNAAMTVTVAGLIFASLVVPRIRPHLSAGPERFGQHGRAGRDSDVRKLGQDESDFDPAWLRLLLITQVASVVWTVAAVATLILTYIDTAGSQAYQGSFSAQLGGYVTQVDSGRIWLGMTLLVAVLSTLIFAVRSYALIAWLTALSLIPIVLLSLMGHSAEASGHTQAVNSLGLHILAAVVWGGGLIVLALLAPQLTGRTDLRAVVERYSNLALASVAVIVFSGIFNAVLRVHTLADWMTPYGLLIVAKALATVLLAVIGYLHRRYVIARLGDAPRTHAEVRAAKRFSPTQTTVRARSEFWRLILTEAVIMGGVFAAGVVLARSQPPVPQEAATTLTPAEILTGEPLPPEPTWANYFTQTSPDPLWIAVAAGASVAYFMAWRSLRRKGVEWPVHRMLLWWLGMALLLYVTCGGPVVYGQYLFSGHMIQHMLIVMAVPLPMVLGSPITLLMRAASPRQDGSRGFREWILILAHSRYLQFWAHPVVAGINFSGSLIVFYWAGIMWYALDTHLGHELMIAHFLGAGYMFASAMIGTDPGGKKYPPGVSLLVLLITMAFHAFFGISIMSATALIEGDWYGNIGQEWISAIDDQQLGGDIAWGIGELPTLFLAIIAAAQWAKQSKREAKRHDRSEDRTGDAELKAYNDMLAALSTPRRVPAGAQQSGRAEGADSAQGGESQAMKPHERSNEESEDGT